MTFSGIRWCAQAPMHTKSLATLRQGHVRRQLGKAAKEARGDGAANGRRHAPINGQATNSLTNRQAGAAGQPTSGVVDGQATNGTGGGGAYAVISAMAAKSRAIGSSAADLLQKEADARCSNGAPQLLYGGSACCRLLGAQDWETCAVCSAVRWHGVPANIVLQYEDFPIASKGVQHHKSGSI